MLWGLLALSVIISLFLFLRLYLYKTEAKKLQKELNYIINHDTNINVSVDLSEQTLRQLALGLSKDIVELKNLKHQYRQKDTELRESIANVSHDLRTPLTIIASYSALLSKLDDPKVQEILYIIDEQINKLNSLIEELFNYSLYENEQVIIELTPLSLNDLLEKSLIEFYDIFLKNNITPQIDITSKNIVLPLNEKALNRIFSNILNNAAKYSLGDLAVSLDEQGVITFINTTSSLDEVSVNKLFDRFFTVENGRNSSGLGLAIAKALVKRLNGSINASLRDNKLVITIKFGK